MICPMCDEKLDPGDVQRNPPTLYTAEGPRAAHRECMLRVALGGIGHLIDHQHFCIDKGDPDAGLPFHLSAKLVDVWVAYYGVERAAAIQP